MKSGAHTILWRRHDMPGHEACVVLTQSEGWLVSGVAVFAFERRACRLEYEIECDAKWLTRSAKVRGWLGEDAMEVEVKSNRNGRWMLNGVESPAVEGCLDIDLNFSPSTNLLPIRRLDIREGERAAVRAAWLRFPSFALEPLEQSYSRLDLRTYRYESAEGRFVTTIKVDDFGLPVEYPGIWSREEG